MLLENPAGQRVQRSTTNPSFNWANGAHVGRSYATNRANQTTSNADGVAGTSETLTWSGAGRLASDGLYAYAYDADGRLTMLSNAGGSGHFTYDPMGRLRRAAAGPGRQFGYDGTEVIAEYDDAGNVLRRYVHGPGVDEPLAVYDGNGADATRWFVQDELGSTIALVDRAGAYTINRYDEYGVPAAGNQGLFQYTGQMWLSEAGVYHYKARAYSPTLGRFLQPDPIGLAGGSLNLYAYVGNDPVNATDPSGLARSNTATGSRIQCIDTCQVKTMAGGYAGPNMSDRAQRDRDRREQARLIAFFRGLGAGVTDAGLVMDFGTILDAMLPNVTNVNGPRGGVGGARGRPGASGGNRGGMASGNMRANPDARPRDTWGLTRQGATRFLHHDRFGSFFKSRSDGTWWARDQAGHGGSAFKVFREETTGLRWIRDADRYGNYIGGKHKSDTGMFIPWREFGG